MDFDPSVFWSPNLPSPMACSILTRAQSASSSSAATIGSDVRMPVPISERCATMCTVPSGSMPRYRLGWSAAASALVRTDAVCARSDSGTKRAATTNAPAENTPPRKCRRLTLAVTMAGELVVGVMTVPPPRA